MDRIQAFNIIKNGGVGYTEAEYEKAKSIILESLKKLDNIEKAMQENCMCFRNVEPAPEDGRRCNYNDNGYCTSLDICTKQVSICNSSLKSLINSQNKISEDDLKMIRDVVGCYCETVIRNILKGKRPDVKENDDFDYYDDYD